MKMIEDAAQLDAAIRTPGLVVVEFTAEWCGPCRFIAPKYDQLSNNYRGTFATVDIDKVSDAALVKTIRSVPTFMFYKDGSKVAEFAGADEGKLRSTIEANM